MKTLLLAAASATALCSAPAAFSAECVNGYMTLDNGVIFTCGGAAAGAEAGLSADAAVEAALPEARPAEPMTTASIGASDQAMQAGAATPFEAETSAQPIDAEGGITAEAGMTAAEPMMEAEAEQTLAWSGGPECVNGYVTLGNGVIFTCGATAAISAEMEAEASAAPQPAAEVDAGMSAGSAGY